MRVRSALAAVAAVAFTQSAHAQPVGVTYSVSGSAGNWALDFSVSNNIAAAYAQSVYTFGVHVPGWVSQAPAPGWTYNQDLNTVTQGGPDLIFDPTWIGFPPLGWIGTGHTASGFVVNTTSVAAPASVDWFAYSARTGAATNLGVVPGAVNGHEFLPLFVGTATAQLSAVPEPSTWALMGTGLLAVGGVAARRRKGSATV